ncbi:hypothetical protein OHA84_15610 [Streptomyces sp. NBC_00513]|uniref:hypothetical protein n=1 Tax=unclassified Streptomyces TaxID=2593676 RepID=UPI00225449FF|nr:hypothetical protein [Streptomyces sp. NBC_00424]MCX5075035.1 hypothetical protein [Streptomyces sp. NBC_00424]WUD41815.1 hypothetical protein OHA84_15610 [Streptomyces sp. NBC_00513]
MIPHQPNGGRGNGINAPFFGGDSWPRAGVGARYSPTRTTRGPPGPPGGARGRWIAHQVLDGELVVLVVEVGDRRDAYRRI